MSVPNLIDARANTIEYVEAALYALLSANADEARRDTTYLRVLTSLLHVHSFLLEWEPE